MKTKLVAVSVALVAASVFLTACSSPNAASAGNFEHAINAYFTQQTCVALPIPTPTPDSSFPLKIPTLVYKSDPGLAAELNALTTAGLLNKAPAATAASGGLSALYSIHATYTLTPMGKAAQSPKNPMALCAGRYRVLKVTDFTKPADGFGETVSTVQFVYNATGFADWAHNPALMQAYPALTAALAGDQKGVANMVLKNSGWSVSGTQMPAQSQGF